MATYGSSLDSLMANRLAEDALAAREQASYRDYLNAMANTNIRGREQQSMDRYRQGELGSRNLQTQAYRDVGLGQSGAYRDVGLNQGNAYRDVGLRGYDVQRELGLGQQGVQRELGLQDIGVRYDLGKRQSDLGGRQLDVNRELGLGQLQLNRDVATRMTPLQQALVDQYGGVGQAIQQVPGAFGAGQSQEMQLLRANKQMEEESAYQNALNASTQQALEEYGLQTESGFGWRWNSDRTGAIQDIIKNYGVTAPQAARIYTENRLAPTFGRTSRFQNLMAPQASSPSGQTNTASMVPSMQGYQQWLQGRSGK
jgi:hypothetical protein